MISFIFAILPLVFISIAVVLLINNIKKKDKIRKTLEDEKSNKNKENIEADYMTIWMSLGMCFGIAIGSIFANTFGAESISYGISFGMLGGMLIGMTIKKK